MHAMVIAHKGQSSSKSIAQVVWLPNSLPYKVRKGLGYVRLSLVRFCIHITFTAVGLHLTMPYIHLVATIYFSRTICSDG